MSNSSKCDRLLVAAIDFGTTYSGYAFSFKHEYESDPLKIAANQWTAGSRALVSLKTPTCVLCSPEGEFKAFGFDAEDKYSELALDEEHHDWYYFRRFKMLLYDKVGLKRTVMVEDDKGKTLPAVRIFAMSLKFLKEHMMKTCNDRLSGFNESDIQWVVTVPAIWNDAAKQFMREAAEQAGIQGDQLMMSLEPEAASLFCKYLPVDKMCGSEPGFSAFKPGTKYLVLDAGGGTIDITVHEVQSNSTVRELHKANGGDWGGTKVDRAFANLLSDIVGNDVMEAFVTAHKADLLDMYREFEVKKRTITPDMDQKVTFKVPIQLAETFKSLKGKPIKDEVSSRGKFSGKLTWTGDKIRMTSDLAKALFGESCDAIIKHLKDLFKEPGVKEAETILMVGGFSESPMLQDAIRKHFKGKRIIIPQEAGLAVLKGAVVFGHNPKTISARVCKLSYGVEMVLPFVECEHPANKKEMIGGNPYCADIFSKHVEMGQTVCMGESAPEQRYTPARADSTSVSCPIFMSTEKNPKFTSDSCCTRLGELVINIPDTTGGKDRPILVKMIFGGTELGVEAKEQRTGKITQSSFNFLG